MEKPHAQHAGKCWHHILELRSLILFVDNYKETLRKNAQNAQGIFKYHAKMKTAGFHPALYPDNHAELEKLKPENCLAALINSVGDISGATLLICGRFDKANAVKLAQSYGGNLCSTVSRKSVPIQPYQFSANIPGPDQLHIGDVPNRSTTFLQYPVEQWGVYAENHKRFLASRILNTYLLDRIRFKNQDTYTITASLGRNPFRIGDHLLSIQFTSASTHHALLKENIFSAMRNLSQAQVGEIEEYLKLEKMKQFKERDQGKHLTTHWTDALDSFILPNLDLTQIAKKPDWDSETTAEDIRSILSQVCDISNKPCVEVSLHPQIEIEDTPIDLNK